MLVVMLTVTMIVMILRKRQINKGTSRQSNRGRQIEKEVEKEIKRGRAMEKRGEPH